MKVLIILSVVVASFASLEPAEYRPPASSYSAHYLPPNELNAPAAVPSFQYLPVNRYRAPQNVLPTSQYLPPVRQSVLTPSVSRTTYLPIPSHQSRIPTLPSTNYLTANRQTPPPFSATSTPFSSTIPNQTLRHGVSAPSNVYLPGNRFPGFGQSSSSFGKSFAGPIPSLIPPVVARAQASQYLPPNQFGSSKSSGYDYNAIDVTTPAKYDFEYSVNDEYGNDFGHKERRSGDTTEGVYTVLLPDGRKQTVHYRADQNGFQPRISYEETRSGSNGYNNANKGYHSEGPY
ncbi:uncharacterized protein LOC117171766 [Belonocnema kinseyi]|uniref:uncharacterized protein LOC117171766 n=1 Tax=Belonocnema kinseyi TaxID=2817044 RepID=UPI00143CD969|nr:uncharacterized protein LOC117171766 [Belonocnema kinseyi]